MKKLLTVLLAVCTATTIHGQTATSNEKGIMLSGATAHLGNGVVIPNSLIGFQSGKITVVSDATAAPSMDLSKYDVVEVTGKHIYPGFILMNSQLGLQEVESIRAMDDFREVGRLNPNLRAQSTYNTDSEVIPTLRFNGILMAEATPTGGLLSGTSSLMKMDGWDWAESTHTADFGIHLNWPGFFVSELDTAARAYKPKPNPAYEKNKKELLDFFTDARNYPELKEKPINLKLEAMQGLFDGRKALFIHAHKPKEIIESVLFAKRAGVSRIVLVGGTGCYPVAGFLAEQKVPVVLSPTHMLPAQADDDIDGPYKLPGLLTKAGVTVAIGFDNPYAVPAASRNLPFFAGTAATYGLDKEEALKLITSNPAAIIGISNNAGTVEVGKEATLIVSAGDALDPRTSIIQLAFINGKMVNLDGKQQALYKLYSEKYGHLPAPGGADPGK